MAKAARGFIEWIALEKHLDRIDAKLDTLTRKVNRIMADAATLKAALDRINTGLDGIVQDIKDLKALIGTGMTQAEVDAAQAAADALVSRVEALDAENPPARK